MADSKTDEEDLNNPTLKSKDAIAFWEKNFGDKESVSNKEFSKAIIEMLEEQKNSDEKSDDLGYNVDTDSQKLFAKMMVERIFWPAEDLTRGVAPGHVDKHCVQFAINTFGPWSQIFQTIHHNLEDATQPHKPLQYFHGRTPKSEIDKKLLAVGDFALRYNYGDKGLILSWAKPTKDTSAGLIIKDEKVRRRKVKTVVKKKKKKGKKGKKKKEEPPPPAESHIYWTYIEKVAEIGGMREDTHNFDSLGAFLNHKKGAITTNSGSSKKKKKGGANIKNPVMYGSAYQTFGVDTSSMTQQEREAKRKTDDQLENILTGVDLSQYG